MNKDFKDKGNNVRIGEKAEPPRMTSILLSYVEILLWQMVGGGNKPRGKNYALIENYTLSRKYSLDLFNNSVSCR